MKKEEQYLELEKEKAVEAYNKGTDWQKKMLIDMYGREHFITDITELIVDYASACKDQYFEPLSIDDFEMLPEEDRNRYYARHQLTTVIRSLNKEWIPDWDNSNELKYYNYFYKDKGGFDSYVGNNCHVSTLGSDLYLKNNTLAQHVSKICRQQYIDYLF